MRRKTAYVTSSPKHEPEAATALMTFLSKFWPNTRHSILGKVQKFQDARSNGSKAAGEKLPERAESAPQGIGLSLKLGLKSGPSRA